MKKHWKSILLVALFVGATSTASASSSRKATGLSVIVAPANYTVLQVAFDIADQYPALIVSYEDDGNVADPFLHVWNGTNWRRLPVEGFAAGDFLSRKPSQVLVIGDESAMSETLLAKSESWGPQAYILPKTPLRELLNQLGQRFHFGKREWFYFADRYKLSVIDLNSEKRDASWYDGKLLKDPPRGGATPHAIPSASTVERVEINTAEAYRPPVRRGAVTETVETRVIPSTSAITSVTTIDGPVVTEPVVVEATTVDAPLPAVRFSAEAYEKDAATPPSTLGEGLPAFKGWDKKDAIKADPVK